MNLENFARLRAKAPISAVIVAGILAIAAPSANASVVTLQDNYVGGNDYGNFGDSIGGGVFNISSLTVQRYGADLDNLQIVINTAYAGAAGTDGTGYGDLFITPKTGSGPAWNPTGSAPYTTDVYQPGEWAYAFSMPSLPTGTSGSGSLYLTADGQVITSSVGSCSNSYPADPSCGFYYRSDQAVQFNPGSAPVIATGTWSVDAATQQIKFDITDNGLLGNDFALAWAMTCANDVIQGEVAIGPGIGGVPEPATWAMMLIGFVGVGVVGMRMRRRNASGLPTAV